MSSGETIAVQPGFWQNLRNDYFFWLLLALLGLLAALDPAQVARYPGLVDWHTIAALTGLLVLTKGIELSGYLQRWSRLLLERLSGERSLAMFLVAVSALLATVLTNDIALFIVVPLTLSLREQQPLPIARLIIFEALAVNVGSVLTPIGNPQNLFLWHLSGTSFAGFTFAMLPLLLILLALLLLLTFLCFPRLGIKVASKATQPRLRKAMLVTSLLLYAPFLAAANLRCPEIGLGVVVLIYLFVYREVLARADWGLIALFILMFIDLRLLAEMAVVRQLIDLVQLQQSTRLYLGAAAISQLISNVPAAILLAEYTADWRIIAYGVNVGGFGFVLGSLANLIALRLAQNRAIWLTFHLYSIPFLLIAAGVVYAALFLV